MSNIKNHFTQFTKLKKKLPKFAVKQTNIWILIWTFRSAFKPKHNLEISRIVEIVLIHSYNSKKNRTILPFGPNFKEWTLELKNKNYLPLK